MSADKILYNGKIITVNEQFLIVEAVAVKDGKFIFVGSNEGALELGGLFTEKIDLHGATVIPGIIEGHSHLDMAAVSELYEDIPIFENLAELLLWIKDMVRQKKYGEWIVHPLFFATRLKEMTWPSLDELDRVAPENPIFLNGFYGGMINSAAYKVSGISEYANIRGVLRDGKSGRFNGFIRQTAFKMLKGIEKPHISQEEKINALNNMLKLYNKVGITGACVGMGDPESLNNYYELKERGDLGVRIFHNMSIPGKGNISFDEIREIIKGWNIKTGDGDEWIRIGGLKTWVDGGILTGTAWMKQPWGKKAIPIYKIDKSDYRGNLLLSESQLEAYIKMAVEFGWKFVAHVTGDAAVEAYLKAAEEVNKKTSLKGRRFSILHGNFYNNETMKKMVDMDIYAEMQPAWFFKDADTMKYILGEDKIREFHPYKSLINEGVMVNGGSDHMMKLDDLLSINPYNPFLAMWSLVTRKTERGSVIVEEEAISREDALRLYTINNAHLSFEENIKGSIEVGKLADLVVLSDDILHCHADKIKEITVNMTIVGGKIVYEGKHISRENIAVC
jgi:predicted amidohydrolase YtcJ